MIYPFKCPECGTYEEIVRMVVEAHLPLVCDCGERMKRVWTSPLISVPASESYYNHGLGCEVHHKGDVTDALKKMRDGGSREAVRVDDKGKIYTEKVDVPGREVVEVGNDYKSARSIKRKEADYTVPRGLFD